MAGIGDMPAGLCERFDALGVVVVEYVLTAHDLTTMEAAFPTRAELLGGARAQHFEAATLDWLAYHGALLALGHRLAGHRMRLHRALALDQSLDANWLAPWHQDRADELGERSAELLARMIALRIHIDDCDGDGAPLEVVPGSHMAGRLDRKAIGTLTKTTQALTCLAVPGDIVAVRPLLVHRSQRPRVGRAQRVIHLEYLPA